MSRFFATGSDSDSDTSSEKEIIQRPLSPVYTFSDDEEEVKRLVRWTKEKRYEELTKLIKQIRNFKKDMSSWLSSLGEDLQKAYVKALPVVQKEDSGQTPLLYTQYLVELQDFINEMWEDREGRKNLGPGLASMRQKLSRANPDMSDDDEQEEKHQCEKEVIVTTKDLQEEGIEGKLETSVISPKLNVKPAAVTSEPIQTKPVPSRISIKRNRDIQKTETKEKLQASKHKLNRSLEEGELLSDDDKSPRKDNKYKKCKTEDVGRTKSKSTSSSLKNISSKQSRNQQNRLQDLRESFKYPPHVVDRSRDSISGTSSSSKSNNKNKISDKNTTLSTSSISSNSKTSSKYKGSASSSSRTSSKYKGSASSSSRTSSKYKISHSASSSSKSSSKSKIPNSTSSSSKSSSKNEIPDKSTKISTPNISSSAKTSSKNTSDNTTKLNDMQKEIQKLIINKINEMDCELQFANKVYTEETYKILTHNYSKVSDRTLSDYNLEIPTKKFSEYVYISETDAEVESKLTVTPFEFLVDIPSAVEKQTAGSSKPNKSHLTNEQSKNKKTPVNILNNQLVKPADETARSSPLEDLYEPTSTSRDQKRAIEKVRPKIMDKNKKNEKSETNSSSKHTNKIEENSRDEKQSADKILEDRLTLTVQEPEAIQNKTDINLEGREPSINVDTEKSENAAECSVQDTKHSPNHIEEKLRVIDGVIMLNASKDEKTAVLETSFEANDDLMNYALVGSDRVENSDSPALDNSLFTAENRILKMSRFFATGSDSDSDTSSEKEIIQRPLAPVYTFSDDEEEVKRLVRWTKEKRYEELTKLIKQIRNFKKDMSSWLSSLGEDLQKAYVKALPVVQKEDSGQTPLLYTRYLVELEDFINEMWEDCEGRKNRGPGLASMRQKLSRANLDMPDDDEQEEKPMNEGPNLEHCMT